METAIELAYFPPRIEDPDKAPLVLAELVRASICLDVRVKS